MYGFQRKDVRKCGPDPLSRIQKFIHDNPGTTIPEIAKELHLHYQTISNYCRRFGIKIKRFRLTADQLGARIQWINSQNGDLTISEMSMAIGADYNSIFSLCQRMQLPYKIPGTVRKMNDPEIFIYNQSAYEKLFVG